MPSRHGRRPATRAQRRKLVWAQFVANVAFTANSQYISLALLSTYKAVAGAQSAGITIMRTHLWVTHQAPVAADSFYIGLRVDDAAQAIAVPAAVAATNPNPRDNPYVDWMWSERYLADSNGNFHRPGGYQGIVVDSHAKRRMEEVQEAYLVTLVQDQVTTVAKAGQVFARTLIALP